MCAKTITHYTPEMQSFLILPGSIDETLDFKKIFGNSNPVEIEIGTGKGRFILAESLKRPDTNFLGIERSQKWLRVTLLRAAKSPRNNMAFLCLDADMVVKLLLQPNSIQAYHVYFPDPWPKERHHKRRLFNPRFIEKLADTLIPQGTLYLKTDHPEYFNVINNNILQSNLFEISEQSIINDKITDSEDTPETATHYEIKFRQESKQVYFVTYKSLKKSAHNQKD